MTSRINGNSFDMSSAHLYRKVVPVLAMSLEVAATFVHSWGDQTMNVGDILIVDPATSTCWGCEADTFAKTYEALQDLPGFYCKTARVRAVKMQEAFFVNAIDRQTRPETGRVGDYLVETVRSDGVRDRYLIPAQDFERMYQVVDE